MNGIKKISIRLLIILYGCSYLLQNTIFVDRKKVYAAENPSTTNIVAVFVDKAIYQDIKTNLVRYTTKYIQKKIANSKAVVFPIDTKTLKAHEISQILENMYFEGIKDESSKLVGTILIGDVPLPVVENNGFIYPSIYPYVDFEEQQFIYDSNKKFFVNNGNPNGQAELWHGIIKFEKTSEYATFFKKVKSYDDNPTKFIDKAIWYDDFIGTKKYFIPENTKYYINSLLFGEDIGYHRFTNLLLNILKDEHNQSTVDLGNDLKNDLQDIEDPELKAYANDIAARNNATSSTDITSAMPTLTLKKATQEMLKGYDGLIGSQFLAKTKDNIAGLARRYKVNDGETFTDYSSTTDKIVQKDNRVLGDIDNEIQPLLIQMNDFLESGLNTKIEQEKYYLTIPIPVSELDFEGKKKGTIQKKCTRKTYNYYENYYFGKNANSITNAEGTNIYRGTFQNLQNITGIPITEPLQSIGGSYNIFSTQVEANRGYDFSSTQEELVRYDKYKINKQSLRQLKCTNYFLGRTRLNICLKPRIWTVNDTADENKCIVGNIEKQGGCESLTGFATRNRGGASPMNINSTTQKLDNYNYKNAVLPIYNIAGSKKIDIAQSDANSYKGITSYTAMIQKTFALGDIQYGGNNIISLIANPKNNGNTIGFTNQLPIGNPVTPTWVPNPPRTYAQTNFFTQFYVLPNHIPYGNKAVLYKQNPGECGGNGSIYTYKTIDSRVKNISPSWDQVSNIDFYKFKNGSDLEIFYNEVIKSLIQTKTDILKKNTDFIGTTATNTTGVLSNLNRIKLLILEGNNGLQNIVTFNPVSLSWYTQAQVLEKANQRSGENFNATKIAELNGRIQIVNEGLEGLLNYITNLNINNVEQLFTTTIQSENFKNQKVEILNSWKTNLTQNLDYITTNTNTLKTTFTQARGVYNTITQINNSIVAIQAQKAAIGFLSAGNGCDANHYKPLCDVLSNIISTLQTHRTNINEKVDKIHQYEGDSNENGIVTTVKPFVEINQTFTHPDIATEIIQTKSVMNTFEVSSDSEKKDKNKGMNLTTQDRPIDNIRNITFQGVGGDLVQLNYPNLYEVEIYKTIGNKKIIKTPIEIREAIKTYLIKKTTEYNNLLTIQNNKKNQYYQTWSAQFNFLEQIDPLANPNSHNYNLLPANYFISQLTTFLDRLESGFGTTAIYGKAIITTTIDTKLDMIAKLLYYQNISRPERIQQNNVVEDIKEIKSSFDINQKISNVVNTYLTEGNDQGKFITPTYNKTGYEIGYINSDGQDYVSAQTTPAFIQQIQNIQEKKKNTTTPAANSFIEKTDSDKLQAEINSCEGVDTQGVALLFDIKTFSSPWMKAMKCWIAKVIEKPLDIKIGFKNALGPVFIGTLKEIGSSLETAGNQWTEYGAQRNPGNNEETINASEGDIKQKIQGYNTYGLVQIDKTIISVDSTTNSKLHIGMAKDMGDINVKISGTGDNCVGISRKGNVLSPNICTKKAQEYYNPNTDNYAFDIVLKQRKAGTTSLKIELCPSLGNSCIVKQQVINILPGPVAKLTIQTPTAIVMAGGELPIMISAVDAYDNSIGQSTQAYTISVNSGDGQIYDGATSNTSIKFDNFLKAGFIYKAPVDVETNRGITITLTPDAQKLLTTTTSTLLAQKKIIIAKGVVNITHKNITLYNSENNQINQQAKIMFDLPAKESDIQFIDNNNIPQINLANITKLSITVKDKNGNKLDTVANISNKQGLLQPGMIKTNTIENHNQTLFSPENNFIIKDGKLDIALYPNFKAGDDTIIINIPGIDPISIPVVVNAGEAKTVLLSVEKNRLDLTTTTGSKGTIQVVDSRNNKVTQPTTIKLGVIGAATTNVSEFIYTGNQYSYTLTAKKPGGEGYVFGYIKDKPLSDQMPGYEKIIVQESLIPKEKLNVMYLNLFGTDRGNQRGYFSENDKVINKITNQSNKLLTTTTQLIDPGKIKQIEYIISANGQIKSIKNTTATLAVENKKIVATLPEVGKVYLGASNNFTIKKIANSGQVVSFAKNTNTILYIPEATDSIITSNETTSSKITINGNDILDLTKGTLDTNATITADNEMLADISTYNITFNGKNIGKILIWNNDSITTNEANIDIQDPIVYGKTKIFNEGSTNTEGIGIYVQASAFTKQGYRSIEDSSDSLLGIGFTSDFKNVSNFANGKSVGESTLPYGSQFLINFGDPLLERREKNPTVPNTKFDAAIGQTIYADPNKTIFKVLPIDFNKDGLKDLLIVYTDGVIKLVKNYGGTDPYKNLQELMIIADAIKDIKIGDVDGNGYDDILIMTINNKGIVYLNNKGIFAVDGKNICLNINTEPNTSNPKPDDFGGIKQLFVEDMDKDGKIDIVTNDNFNDIKIFYGGSTNNGANYLSSTTGICDANWYTRQKNNYKTIKRFGIKINNTRHIQDESLIHRKGVTPPVEGIEEEVDAPDDNSAGSSITSIEEVMDSIKNMTASTSTYIAAGSSQLAYVDNPLTTAPVYESLDASEISYLPIRENNPAASVYKEYVDINGGVLRKNDEVVIKTTIISKKNNNKLTYIDQAKGPRSISRNAEDKIKSFVFTSGNTGGILINRNGPEGYQFVLDNIQLNSGASISFSYTVKYTQEIQATTINVEDQDLVKINKHKDTYADIITNSTDACQKNRWMFFNEKTGNKRTYEQIYDNVQAEIDNYNSGANATSQTALDNMINEITAVTSLDSVGSLPGMDSLEPRSAKNILSSLFSQDGLSININTNFIDEATAKASKKIDEALQGLCQGFKIGNPDSPGCQGIPVPFNQAFLAPGDYHIFGCVPKAPNPLAAVFSTINKTLGKGIPVLTIPANIPNPVAPGAYIPIPGIFGLPIKAETDKFLLGAPGGISAFPSLFRLYLVPTLTLGLGIAMCFGPYSVGTAIPKPFRDLGGNCVVFALPPLTTCPKPTSTTATPTTESLGSSMIAAAGQGTCNNPPKIGNTIVFAGDTTTNTNNNNSNGQTIISVNVSTASSPFEIVAANSSENSSNYSSAIPQGNFGGLITIDQEPIHVSASEDYGNATEQIEQGTNYEGYTLEKGEKINLKILGGKAKGLVKCVIQDRSTRQIKYIQNNLTKMTIQVDLPDLTTIVQGFDKISGFSENYKSINEADQSAGYTQSTNGQGVGTGRLNDITQYFSKQQIKNISKKVGENPFEAIQQMFSEVPLVNIDTKDINLKIPALTSDDINKYHNYLRLRVEKNGKIVEDRGKMINKTLAMCGTTEKPEAQKIKTELEKLKIALANDRFISQTDKQTINQQTDNEINKMKAILAMTGTTTRQKLGEDINNIGINLQNTKDKLRSLPMWKKTQTILLLQKEKEGRNFKNQASLDLTNIQVQKLEKCSGIATSANGFVSFRENSAGLIRSVKQNINVLEKYKQFPTQLYERTHISDRYLTELSSLLSDYIGSIMSWTNTNANRFSQYVDAIVLIVGAIKTWQAVIDFSVNRSEKCSKCSNDNYGSFSCSLSFLCPKLPIFPIPAFKIPNIYMDLSHVELGMNIILPKINFVPIKIPLPQLPNLPEPPTIEINRDILYGLNIDFFKEMSLPTIPVIPEPPTLPEPPSFIPSIKIDLPVLPPAPKIPQIIPEIKGVLKVATFVGKVFCIVKGGIGLVGEKGVKGKVEQITQRTWNVPVFDYFDLTTKFQDPPLQGFDYRLDAYTTLKFNFDGVYDVFNSIAQTANKFVSQQIEAPIQKAIDRTTENANNNSIVTGILNPIEDFDQNINFNSYHAPQKETGMLEYANAYNELKQGLLLFKNSTLTDKKMNDTVKTILATIENKSTIRPENNKLEQVEKASKEIINEKIKENQNLQKQIKDYDTFIKSFKDKNVLVDAKTTSANFSAPLMNIDTTTKNILQTQEDPTKTYLTLNKNMVQGYLDAVNNDGAEKLNMTKSVYNNSKTYLETTKEKIDSALLAYNDGPLIAQTTCTNCSTTANTENNYSTDISAYVQGVFVESYSGNKKNMINTVSSTVQAEKVQKTYTTTNDLNNDNTSDILMYDSNAIYVKYGKQESKYFSAGGNALTTYYTKFYSYESDHFRNRSIGSTQQLKDNSDDYGYIKINGITIKVVDKNKEVKNFKTDGQSFDTLQLSWKNSKKGGENADGYIIKLNTKVDQKDTPRSFRDFLGRSETSKYIVALPKDSDYKKGLITIDNDLVKKSINLELEDTILAVEYYDPDQDKITLTLKDLPRKWLYTSIATLSDTPNELNSSQRSNNIVFYKKSSPWSNQTVAGLQNLGDTTAPVGEVTLWRNLTNETISTGMVHNGFINTSYTLKSLRTDNVIVSKMIVQKDGQTILQKENQSQTGILNIEGLFFTGATQQQFDFIAIDQNNNTTKQTITVNIGIPDIEVVDVKKTGDATADIVAKISNDLDEGMIIFQRLRNGIRNTISGSNQNGSGGFTLSPRQTLITGGIFTMGNTIGLYDNQGVEIATIDPKTAELKITQGLQNRIKTYLDFSTHIPVVELRDTIRNTTLFQIVLPVEAITKIQMNENNTTYKQLKLQGDEFGAFSNGYCIKNSSNDCIFYTNNVGAMYIPGSYATSLGGEYMFDATNKQASFVIKDQANNRITKLNLKIKVSQ